MNINLQEKSSDKGSNDSDSVSDNEQEDNDQDDLEEQEDQEEVDINMGSENSLQDDAEQIFQGHTDSVLSVAWNKNENSMYQVASGGQDEKAFLFEIGQEFDDGLHTKELKAHKDSIVDLKFNKGGNYLATGGMDGQVIVWDTKSGEAYAKLEGISEAITWVDWHPVGDILLAGSEDYTLWMWNAKKKVVMQTFIGHGDIVVCGGFSKDGRVILSGGDDSSLRVWDPKQGLSLHNFQGHPWHTAGITNVECTSDNKNIISGGIDGTIKLTNLETEKFLANFGDMQRNAHDDSIEGLQQNSSMDNIFVSGGMDGKAKVWDLRLASLQASSARVICNHEQGVVRIKCHPNKPQFFTCCVDGGIRQWDLRQGLQVSEKFGHTQAIQDMDIQSFPNGVMALTGGDDGLAKVFVFLD